MKPFLPMATVLKPSRVGSAEIRHFAMTEDASRFTAVRAAMNNRRSEFCPPGTYAQLLVDGQLVMSDTLMEQQTNLEAVLDARGDVLIGGLGLGLVVLGMLANKKVSSIRVVEKNRAVIRLVAYELTPYFAESSVKFVVEHGDIWTWEPKRPGRQFDYVYLDIWPDVCTDDLDEHVTLRKKFRRYLRKGGTIGSWNYEHLKDLKRRGR